MSSLPTNVSGSQGWFPETRWSIVVAAQETDEESSAKAAEAMGELCQMYWRPVYRFMRSSRSTEDAKDLTQEFFAKLLSKDSFRQVAQDKGKLRTFLLLSAKRFLINETEKARRLKRGGGVAPLSIDIQEDDEAFVSVEPMDSITPEVQFERQWALTLLDKVLSKLEKEYQTSDRQELFAATKEYLTSDTGQTPYREIGEQLKLTEGALRISVFRMRRRYRELLQGEIANTVDSEDSIEDEIHHLMNVFSNSAPNF